jgi:hypothetical protein
MPVISGPLSGPVPGAQCAWELDTSCCTGWDEFSDETRTAAAAWATGILDALTGHRFAQCPVKLRPCGKRCGMFGGYLVWPVGAPAMSGAGNPWMIPWVDNGVWRNCGCAGPCRCRATCEAIMPFPVASIEEILVDGVVLDPSAYRLDNGNIIVRTDGECFPECQNLDLADTETGTWSVTLRPGEPLPLIGAIAAGELACEYAKMCTGAEGCQLPGELQSLSRNGVQVEMVDPQQLLSNGMTGIPNVDMFLRAVNPAQLRQRSRVYSPDVRNPRRVTL